VKASSVLDRGLHLVFTDPRSLGWHLVLLAIGPAALLISWSDGGLADFVLSGRGPRVLGTATLFTAVWFVATAGAWSLDQLLKRPGYPFVHWLRYTRVRVGSYLAGRALFHLVHTLILAALALPALLAAGEGSLIPPSQVLVLTALLSWYAFTLRLAADAGRRLDKGTGSLGLLVYILVVVAVLLATTASIPVLSAVVALRRLSEADGLNGAVRTLGPSILAHGGIGVAGLALSFARMRQAAVRERRR